jgi:hypothetical protein
MNTVEKFGVEVALRVVKADECQASPVPLAGVGSDTHQQHTSTV